MRTLRRRRAREAAPVTATGAERTLTFRSGEHTPAGTLTVPATVSPATGTGDLRPAALVLSGSGPLDRDSNARRAQLGIAIQLAEALAAAGIVVLRYDKRGVGASSGSYLATGLYDNVDDAAAALQALRLQPEVDPERVTVVGHSEGAVLAAALTAAGVPVYAVALLSPTARAGEDVLLWQASVIASTLPAPVRWVLRLLRKDVVAQVAKNHARIKATTTDVARIGGVRVNARWHREFLVHDPRSDLQRIGIPLLALTGGKDLQAPPQDLTTLAELVPGPVETVLLEDLSHVLRSQPGAATIGSYRKDVRRPVDARVLETVTKWVRRQGVSGPAG